MSDTDVKMSPTMQMVHALILKEFPGAAIRVSKFGIDVFNDVATADLYDSVDIRPEYARKFYGDVPPLDEKVVALQVMYDADRRSTTRYPLKDGEFNSAKFIARVREGLDVLKNKRLKINKKVAEYAEEDRQSKILAEELKVSGDPNWTYRYNLTRHEWGSLRSNCFLESNMILRHPCKACNHEYHPGVDGPRGY